MAGEEQIIDGILKKALGFGASVAGSVPAGMLKDCPFARAAGPAGFQKSTGTVIVLGLYHDPGKPEMDWWEEGRGTPGDRILQEINRKLAAWLAETHDIDAVDIPYQIFDGGIYLKDAAVLAGLGLIGRNNLVITPDFGPRVRFRALWIDIDSEPSGRPVSDLPCDTCEHPCESACPQKALESGLYSRNRCMARMDADKAASSVSGGAAKKKGSVDHCRACELVCPAGLN